MRKVIACLGVTAMLALALGGCNDEQKRADAALIQTQLPPGCAFKDLGYYNSRPVVAVFCRYTTSTRTSYGCGKSTCDQTVVTNVEE